MRLAPLYGENRLQAGDRVRVVGFEGNGTVRYVGTTCLSKDAAIWVGIELDTPEGKHDGLVRDHRYFTAKAMHGIMIKGNERLTLIARRPPPPPPPFPDVTAETVATDGELLATEIMFEEGEYNYRRYSRQSRLRIRYRDKVVWVTKKEGGYTPPHQVGRQYPAGTPWQEQMHGPEEGCYFATYHDTVLAEPGAQASATAPAGQSSVGGDALAPLWRALQDEERALAQQEGGAGDAELAASVQRERLVVRLDECRRR